MRLVHGDFSVALNLLSILDVTLVGCCRGELLDAVWLHTSEDMKLGQQTR